MRNLQSGLLVILIILNLSCAKEVSVSPEPVPVVVPGTKIYIDSRPAGAKIYLNNKNTGYITPDTVKWIEEGIYQLTLKLPYYKDTSIIIDIPSNSRFVDFTSNPNMMGFLQVTSNPYGAEIIINDSSTSQITPFEFEKILPGKYLVEVKKSGFRDGKEEILIFSQKMMQCYLKLTDTTHWVTYNTSNGDAPADNLTSIDIMPDGKIFIGTWGDGLLIYDLKKWTSLNSSNSSLPSDYINRIKSAPDQSVWIATDRGVAVYRNGTFQVYTMHNSGLKSNDITSFEFEPAGGTWIGTSAGLHLFKNGNWDWFGAHNSPFTVPTVSDLAIHPMSGDLWIALYGGGVLKYSSDGSWQSWTFAGARVIPPDSQDTYLLTPNVRTISINDIGQVWIGMKEIVLNNVKYAGGTGYFDFSTGKWFQLRGIPSQDVENIFFDQNNIPWFCNINSGLSKWDGSGFVTYNIKNSGIGSNSINEGISKNGIVWLVSGGGGLIKYKGNN